MKQNHFITQLLGIKDQNIRFDDNILDMGIHKELKASLDYDAPACHHCHRQMGKDDFQKEAKIPFLDCAGLCWL